MNSEVGMASHDLFPGVLAAPAHHLTPPTLCLSGDLERVRKDSEQGSVHLSHLNMCCRPRESTQAPSRLDPPHQRSRTDPARSCTALTLAKQLLLGSGDAYEPSRLWRIPKVKRTACSQTELVSYLIIASTIHPSEVPYATAPHIRRI